jgi:hypothetical protein
LNRGAFHLSTTLLLKKFLLKSSRLAPFFKLIPPSCSLVSCQDRGLYVYWKIPPLGGGKKYEKVKRKRGENVKEKEEREKKMRKGEVKG